MQCLFYAVYSGLWLLYAIIIEGGTRFVSGLRKIINIMQQICCINSLVKYHVRLMLARMQLIVFRLQLMVSRCTRWHHINRCILAIDDIDDMHIIQPYNIGFVVKPFPQETFAPSKP